MFVPKVPRRVDFCGCPPCPLCFDFVEPTPPVQVQEEEPIEAPVLVEERVDGIVQMGKAVLGRVPRPDEMPALLKAAETIHEQNKLRVQDQQQADAARKRMHEERRVTMTVEAVIAAKVKERNAPGPRPELNPVNLDNMDPEKVKEACGLVAPVDDDLLRREAKVTKGKALKEEELQQLYRQMYRR